MTSNVRAYHAQPHQPLRQVGEDSLGAVLSRPGWVWIDAATDAPVEIRRLAALIGLHPVDLDDITEATEFPRAERRENYVFMVAHTPSAAEHRLRTAEADIILGENVLVTFRREPMPGIDAVIDLATDRPLEGPDEAFGLLADVFARRTLPLLDALDAEVDALEEAAILGDPSVPLRVQALRRDVIRLRSVVVRQRDAHRAIAADPPPTFSVTATHRLTSAADDYARAADSLDTARALLASVLDTYRATVAERMNEVMKVLTVFSAIVLPLGLMAGIYGMNFVNMPELEWRWAYFALLGLMAATGLGLWIYFSRRGFIGGPKLPRVDRVVGHGLGAFVHLTLAPIRGLAQRLDGTPPSDRQGSFEEPR